MVIGYLYADGERVAKVGRWESFQNPLNQLWQVTLRGVEFDEGHEPQELYSKFSMLLGITDGEEIGFYEKGEISFYKGQLECSMERYDGFELRMNFQRKESGKEIRKEVKMEMIINENSSLREIKEFCENREECKGCPIRGEMGCKVGFRPDKWDLDFRQKFDEDTLAWMRVMSAGLGENEVMWVGRDTGEILYWKVERDGKDASRMGYMPRELFPCIQVGQRYDVKKVLEESGE